MTSVFPPSVVSPVTLTDVTHLTVLVEDLYGNPYDLSKSTAEAAPTTV